MSAPREAFGHRTVTEADVSSFAALTGDYARMHLDHDLARAAGGATIAHGLLGACWAVGMLTRHAPERLAVADPDAVLSRASFRFRRPVHVGDTIAVRALPSDGGDLPFELVNGAGEPVTTGVLAVARKALDPAPAPWPIDPPPVADATLYAEDLLTLGPCGEGPGRTITASEAVRFATAVGETSPLYLNRHRAAGSRFGDVIAPPMLAFCLGFSDLLDALLALPLPEAGFAGHLGDAWQAHGVAAPGDTVRGRYRTESVRASRTRPGMAVVDFGLQVLDQRDRVLQQGQVTMMVPRRAEGGA